MFITLRKLPEELLHLRALRNRFVLAAADADKLSRLERVQRANVSMTGCLMRSDMGIFISTVIFIYR